MVPRPFKLRLYVSNQIIFFYSHPLLYIYVVNYILIVNCSYVINIRNSFGQQLFIFIFFHHIIPAIWDVFKITADIMAYAPQHDPDRPKTWVVWNYDIIVNQSHFSISCSVKYSDQLYGKGKQCKRLIWVSVKVQDIFYLNPVKWRQTLIPELIRFFFTNLRYNADICSFSLVQWPTNIQHQF